MKPVSVLIFLRSLMQECNILFIEIIARPFATFKVFLLFIIVFNF